MQDCRPTMSPRLPLEEEQEEERFHRRMISRLKGAPLTRSTQDRIEPRRIQRRGRRRRPNDSIEQDHHKSALSSHQLNHVDQLELSSTSSPLTSIKNKYCCNYNHNHNNNNNNYIDNDNASHTSHSNLMYKKLTEASRSRVVKHKSQTRTTTRARASLSWSLLNNWTLSSCAYIYIALTIITINLTILTHAPQSLFVNSYNLDEQKALLKHGPKGSYFGYSIAQHATLDPDKGPTSHRSSIIVGAPRADSSRSPSLAGVQRPGAIYKCDFSLSTACQQLDIDVLAHSQHSSSIYSTLANTDATSSASLSASPHTSSSSSSLYSDRQQQQRPATDANNHFITAASFDPVAQRDDQWLGVSVKSQGLNGYALACAHRYVLKGPQYRWPQGICYSLTKNLTLHRTWQPCLNRPVNKAHEEYGSCQAGTSADISDSSDIVLGSPGPYTWRGTVFSNSIAFTAKDDRTWYMAPVQDEDAKVYKYSYLGMSIVTGKFFNKKQYYISGAPRSNEIGQVLVMTKQSKGESSLRTDQILDGEQMASSFGYSLAKLDFNGDNQLDLAVAAPFYFTRSEGGAVYLYSNDGKAFQPAGKLTGKPESRFGFALANCGDLNHDKYEDLAIGAPYEQQGGSVYIYFGSPSGLKSTPSQVIRASSVGTNLQTFGYSLSGGLDMDQNGYPDLVVGSYADDSIYILRARPIVEISTKIEGNLSRIDPNRTTCDGERNQLPCFKFNTCFELDPAKIGEYSDSMKLKYRIEAETFTGQKYSRVKFQESENTDSLNVVEKEIIIEDYYRGIKLKRCNAQRVYIKDRSDVQTPIQFKLTYSLVPPSDSSKSSSSSSSPSPSIGNRYSSNQVISYSSSYSASSSSSSPSLSSSSLAPSLSSSNGNGADAASNNLAANIPPPFPILNQDEAQRIFSAKFLKDCGVNDICESHLDVDGSLQMPRETLGVNEPGYPSDKQVNVTVRIGNSNEPAYEAKLFITHPANLIYSGFKATKQVSLVECVPVEKNLVKCELGNPMTKGTTKLLMLFNTQNQAGLFDFNLMVNTTSQNAKEARTSFDLSGTIKRKVEIQPLPKQTPTYPETPIQEPPAWLILLSILLGLLLFGALFYCLYVNGFFERSKARYSAANTEERFN